MTKISSYKKLKAGLKTIQPESPTAEMSKRKYYPSFHISSKELPEVKNWDVGKKYQILLEARQTGKREDEEGISADFEIRKIGKK